MKGGVKRGGRGVTKGDDLGLVVLGLEGGLCTSNCELLSVKIVEPLVRTPFLGQDQSYFSSVFSFFFHACALCY